MAQQKTKYVCQNCGFEYLKWIGKCPSCGSWNTMVEELGVLEKQSIKIPKNVSKAKSLNDITPNENERILCNINEFDRVLGGGLIYGSIVLIAGDPGIGKSTLVLQALANIKSKTLYITGEESIEQIKLRSDRLKLKSDNLYIVSETNLSNILGIIEQESPEVVVIDSIQTMYRQELQSSAGTVGQIRECTSYLMQVAKKKNIAIIIIGHVTKDGSIAGPKILEHIVDAVIQFEGERNYSYRILRSVKNRFGSTNEIGIFEMFENGLKEVKNPSEIFLSQREKGASGSVVTSLIEGTRPILVEVQALATYTNYGIPQRITTGFDQRRLSILLAVLEKRLNLKFSQFNVLINIAGGVSVDVPDADLAICLAVISSIKDKPIDQKICVVGEVGLGGEIRAIYQLEKRIHEAEKLGFKKIFIPANSKNLIEKFKIEIVEVNTLRSAVNLIFNENK